LYTACCPEMVRVDFILENILSGDLKLSAKTILPDGGNSVILGSFVRPVLFSPQKIKKSIDSMEMNEIIYAAANQLDIQD